MAGQQFGIPPKNIATLDYTGADLALTPVTEAGRDPTTSDVRYPIDCLWRNTVSRALWYLSGFNSTGALWLPFTTGSVGPMLMFPVPFGTSPVVPDGLGNVTFTSTSGTITITGGTNTVNFDLTGGGTAVDTLTVQAATAPGVVNVTPTALGVITVSGAAVAAHSVPIETRSRALNAYNVEVQEASAVAATDATKSGISHYDSGQFSVDANGFVQLVGGTAPALQKLNVDASTGPGTDPVIPDGSGQIILTGAQVAAGTVGANVIRTDSLAANTCTIEIQRSTAVGASASANNGVSHFDNTIFTVDANAFVSLVGGSVPPAQKFNVDANTGPGTDPVVPTAAGVVTITGAQVASGTVGTNVIRTDSLAANTYTIEVQRSTAVSATAVANNGVSHFNSNQFTVDSNAFVSTKIFEVGQAVNLGIAYSGSTFSITSSDGSALSSSNIGYVTIALPTGGLNKTFSLSKVYSFIDSTGASQISGNTFGTTAATAWAQDIPFFIYAVSKSDASDATIMISRVPHLLTSPVAGKIAKSGSAVATTQGSMYAFDSGITVADYASQPCVRIGYFRMRKTAGDDWTVQALNNNDGINRFPTNNFFQFPGNQNGATSDTLSSSVGGDTMPTFTQVGYFYSIEESGHVVYNFAWSAISANGVGAGNLRFHLPLVWSYSSSATIFPNSFIWNNVGAANYDSKVIWCDTTTSQYVVAMTTGAGVALLTPAGMTTDKANASLTINYIASPS